MIDPQTAMDTASAVVETTDGGSIRAGIWTGVIVAMIGLVTMIVSHWRGWKETASAGRTADFRRLREEIERRDTDMDEMKVELKDLRALLTAADRRSADMQMRMVRLQTAFQLVSDEMARTDPDNPVLKQARALIATAIMSDDDIFRAGLTTLATGATR